MSNNTWEGGGNYAKALETTQRIAQQFTGKESHAFSEYVAACLEDAHVATLDMAQYRALPLEPFDLLEWVPDTNMPFSPLYVSIGEDKATDNSLGLAGVLFAVLGAQVECVPFYKTPLNWVIPAGVFYMTEHHYWDMTGAMIFEDPEAFTNYSRAEYEADGPVVLARLGTRAAAVLRFIESANVGIEEAPVSRQVRRQAQRKGYKLAHRVYVRQTRKVRTDSGGVSVASGAERTFTHRFEVCGHYKHYGEGTRVFNATQRDYPDKIHQHPTKGPCVRVWCPPFVKGPEDAVLVPKTRVYV